MTEVLSIENQTKEKASAWIDERFKVDSKLNQLKKNAIDRFLDLGLPSRKSEAYKFTPIQKVIEKNFDLNALSGNTSWSKKECKAHFYSDDKANHLVFINGIFVMDYSKIASSSDDLQIKVIDEKSINEEDALSNLLGTINGSQTDPFAALNLAYFSNGLFLSYSKNSESNDTYIYHFVEAANEPIVTYPRLFIEAAEGSSGKIFEKTFTKKEAKYLSVSITEANVSKNASIRYTKIQDLNKEGYAIEGIYGHQQKDSRFCTNTFSFSGAVIRNNIYINVDDENCEAHMYGLYQLSGRTHVDNNTSVDHLKPHSYSNELYKGIVDERSKAVFNGKIYVRPDAQKTNAFQSNNNIILTDTATVNTKPQLEIWADDVQCSHGCTTGQLDEEAIFYLQTRGISKRKARAMMLNAFAGETLKEVKNELILEELEVHIQNKLS